MTKAGAIARRRRPGVAELVKVSVVAVFLYFALWLSCGNSLLAFIIYPSLPMILCLVSAACLGVWAVDSRGNGAFVSGAGATFVTFLAFISSAAILCSRGPAAGAGRIWDITFMVFTVGYLASFSLIATAIAIGAIYLVIEKGEDAVLSRRQHA